MSLLDNAIAMVEDLGAHLKGLAEQEVPALERAQSSLIAQAAERWVLGPDVESMLADVVDTMASKYGTLKADAAPAADATDAAPADPAAA